MRRSISLPEKSSERPVFAGSPGSRVSEGFVGIAGSLALAEGTERGRRARQHLVFFQHLANSRVRRGDVVAFQWISVVWFAAASPPPDRY